jgi:hypothetical protein
MIPARDACWRTARRHVATILTVGAALQSRAPTSTVTVARRASPLGPGGFSRTAGDSAAAAGPAEMSPEPNTSSAARRDVT